MFFDKFDPKQLVVLFDKVEDPRPELKTTYSLREIIFLAIVANMFGFESWKGIAMFGHERLEFLRQFFPFEAGTPSRQTISRVFSIIKPACFESLVFQVTSLFRRPSEKEIIAIDGKTICGTSKMRENPLHILNAAAMFLR
jgi:hypothetical protein